MKKINATITVVIIIGLLPLSACAQSSNGPKSAMFRANLQRTGVYKTKGVHQLTELMWKLKQRMMLSPLLP